MKLRRQPFKIHHAFVSGAMLALLATVLFAPLPSGAQTAAEYRQKALEQSQAKSWDEAIASYRKALELAPDDALTHYNLALALNYKGDLKPAVEQFEAALQLKPKWSEAHYGLGAALYELHDQDGARKELQAALERDPANTVARRLLARIYLEQNNPSAAEGELLKAIQSKPSADSYIELGLAEGQLGKLEAASADFRSALRLNPRLARAHALMGVAQRRQGNHAVALNEFHKAVELDPKDPETQYDFGMELKAGGDLDGAVAAFQRAIEFKPDFEKAHYALGIALRAKGDTAASQKELTDISELRAFRARLAQAKYLTLQGVEALKQQKLEDALSLFQKAVEQGPEIPPGFSSLGITWSAKAIANALLPAFQRAPELKTRLRQGADQHGTALLAPGRSQPRARTISGGSALRSGLGRRALQSGPCVGANRAAGRGRAGIERSHYSRPQVHRCANPIGIGT
jgi:tetratricopeptide (TPR) repeat protein